MKYIYLHGFASSPDSAKARFIRDRFVEKQISLSVPDLNQNNFSELTLTRQIRQVSQEFKDVPVTLIGSSLGGLTAAWLGEKYPQIERLVLLAPAFGFLSSYLTRLGSEAVQNWQESGFLSVYHYAEKRSLPLSYQFVLDSQNYADHALRRSIPTLILPGQRDEVIPLTASQEYAQSRSWVELIELDSDHGLGNALPEIWSKIQLFCDLM
ncbi:MAG: YqiA/YcfP family alpha/beta fold hydrolase [Snowella sp.]|nr:YqiA/YcfP family alpha/beta fold hydrolase [Snowella sp.]